MQNNIIESANLPETEQIYLKKGIFGWAVVQPIKNEDGSTNWINLLFGGYGNLFKLLFFLLVIFLFILGTREVTMTYKTLYKDCLEKCPIVPVSINSPLFLAGDSNVRPPEAGS